ICARFLRVARNLSGHQPCNQADQSFPLLLPGMGNIDFLSTMGYLNRFFRIGCHEFHPVRKVRGIARIKEDQRIRTEIIENACRCRRDYRLSLRQVFKNPCWGVNVSKRVALVRNDTYVTALNLRRKLFELSGSKIMDPITQSEVLRLLHYGLEIWAAPAVNSQLCFGYRLTDLFQCVDCQLKTIPFYERAVIHHHEGLSLSANRIGSSLSKRKHRFIRRIHHDADLFSAAAP